MPNWTEPPQFSAIELCVQISSKSIDQSDTDQLARKLISNYHFEYGYCTLLPYNYDAGSERKVMKGLFSRTVSVNKHDIAWTFHSIGIQEGFIKRLYQINYLNKSHFKDLRSRELISRYGQLEKVTDDMRVWILSLDDYNKLIHDQTVHDISIITEDLKFLKTDKAREFNLKMRLKEPVANRLQ